MLVFRKILLSKRRVAAMQETNFFKQKVVIFFFLVSCSDLEMLFCMIDETEKA